MCLFASTISPYLLLITGPNIPINLVERLKIIPMDFKDQNAAKKYNQLDARIKYYSYIKQQSRFLSGTTV